MRRAIRNSRVEPGKSPTRGLKSIAPGAIVESLVEKNIALGAEDAAAIGACKALRRVAPLGSMSEPAPSARL